MIEKVYYGESDILMAFKKIRFVLGFCISLALFGECRGSCCLHSAV